jgi:hypothetical protein
MAAGSLTLIYITVRGNSLPSRFGASRVRLRMTPDQEALFRATMRSTVRASAATQVDTGTGLGDAERAVHDSVARRTVPATGLA